MVFPPLEDFVLLPDKVDLGIDRLIILSHYKIYLHPILMSTCVPSLVLPLSWRYKIRESVRQDAGQVNEFAQLKKDPA
ncbi:hypothetical protein ES703_123053 [subsurface metagenome]